MCGHESVTRLNGEGFIWKRQSWEMLVSMRDKEVERKMVERKMVERKMVERRMERKSGSDEGA